ISESANARFVDFVHRKIREIVNDPETAEALCPTSHPLGTKRICVDSGYYESFNRDNVTLVNLLKNPIERITETGVQLADGHVDIDTLVLATGFDAMTGAFLNIDIRGKGGQSLVDKWAEGPRAYLGLMMAGFPNMFTITGPGSPSVLSNMLISIEQHVDFIVMCMEYAEKQGVTLIEPELEAEDHWVSHVNDVANATLYPKGGSWYLGANVPGKPRVFMPYAGGVGPYRDICRDVAKAGYTGFVFSNG
ncbi:MAG: cyclohexanone monooxygenase, partial [Proteobacteria bacterium]|nr:cyclohexanone monooxygenase [Pseudomonadota bacterium]